MLGNVVCGYRTICVRRRVTDVGGGEQRGVVGGSMTGRLLVVDDDPGIRELLQDYLSHRGFSVTVAADGDAMHDALARSDYDLVILDVLLPGGSGFELLKVLRTTSDLPVILLTGVDDDEDRVAGLELGADDYVTKPVKLRELLARVNAVLRRSGTPPASAEASRRVAWFGEWRLDAAARKLFDPDDCEVRLTSGEYHILLAMLEAEGRPLSRDHLLDRVGSSLDGAFDRSIDIRISRLRRKIETDPRNPVVIQTVRGAGYALGVDVVWR